jgi:hypothetical protein
MTLVAHFGRAMGRPIARAGQGADASVAAIFRAFTTPPDALHRAAITTFVRALKAGGVWTLLDVLQVYAAADAQAATINWKQPGTSNAVFVNSPTFVADRYVASDGAASYVDLNVNPSTAGGNYAQNLAHAGGWKIDAAPGSLLGNITGTNRVVVSTNAYRINASANAASPTGTNGFLLANRNGASASQLYNGAAQLTSAADASIGMPSSVTVGQFNATFFVTRAAMASIGGSLTAGQEAAFYAAAQNYMTAVGAA